MSSGTAALNPTSKIAPPSGSAPYSQTPSSNASEGPQKRSGSTGGLGAGSSTRHTPQARNNQPLRKQHKAQRRARLVDEDAIAESAAMKSINSRKGQTSITHLMNFTLPPRPHAHQGAHRHARRNPTWGLGSGYHAMDKARYVHANYRFIVRPDREYHAQTVDADVHVGWDGVLQILASAETQSTNCPICLSIPVAPRMAKCGHIFCLPCVIRYMHASDDTGPAPEKRARWKKCPICEDSVYISETRPVRWVAGQDASLLREGGDVLLRLLMREPGTTLALPRDAAEGYGPGDDIPWFHVAEIMEYARFMKGGEDYMTAQYDREIAELETQEKEDELMFGDDSTWSRKAVAAITEAKERLDGMGNPPTEDGQIAEKKPPRDPIPFRPGEPPPDMYRQRTSTPQPSTRTPEIEAAAAGPVKPSGAAPRPPTHPFFFYHALPNFFLSPLDIRILKVAFGDFAAFPSTILPRVEHISTGHLVDDELRKRAKYMSHLPYGCEVSFLECDWTDIIPPAVLAHFKQDIDRRRKRNHEKDAREERERLRAEKEEDEKRWAAARRRRPGPVEKSLSEADFQPLHPVDPLPASPPSDANAFATTPPWRMTRTHSSFATLASPGTSPDAPRTVWGTAFVPPATPPMVASSQDPSAPPPDDGWLQGWERDLLDQNDAIAMAEAGIESEGSSRPSPANHPSRKKKGKKITLMSTNARRGA